MSVFFLVGGGGGDFRTVATKKNQEEFSMEVIFGKKVTCRHRQCVLLTVMRTRQKSRKYLLYRLATCLAKWFIPLLDDH
jgi:hypothetical protein